MFSFFGIYVLFFRAVIAVGFPGGLVVKNLPADAGDIREADSIPGSETAPGGRNGNPLQYSCLEKPTVRGAWGAMVHGVTKSQTLRLKRLSTAQKNPALSLSRSVNRS